MEYFDVLSLMVDCSRNAVMNKDFVKKLVDIISDLGYTELQLYTEDTFEVQGEPYFGYLRGRYSLQDIKEIDAYCKAKNIELVPCVELLAHLDNIFRWEKYQQICDKDNCLLVGESQTYELIENIVSSLAQAFSSRKINIGMDETHSLGLGQYLVKHGYTDRLDIFLQHLNKVNDILKKYGFKPMMWSDMFFRFQNDGVYAKENPVMDGKYLCNKPVNVSLVYWEYGVKSDKLYKDMIDAHKKFGDAPRWAGSAWSYLGFTPCNYYALLHFKHAFPVMQQNGVREYMLTLWGDDGAECARMASLPSIFAFSEMAHGNYDEKVIADRFEKKFGISWADYNLIDCPNFVDIQPPDVYNPSKYMLYNDLFCGIFDCTVKEGVGTKYSEYATKLNRLASNEAFGYVFKTSSLLCKVLAVKYELGCVTRRLYANGDKQGVASLTKRYDELCTLLEEFTHAVEYQWEKENSLYGLEVLTARLGGLILRTKQCKRYLVEWANGQRQSIDLLEEEVLDYAGPRPNKGKELSVVYNDYKTSFTVNYK